MNLTSLRFGRKSFNKLYRCVTCARTLCIAVLLVLNIFIIWRGCIWIYLGHQPYTGSSLRHGHANVIPWHHFLQDDSVSSRAQNETLISTTLDPVTVHFVWCSETHFQFQNFLSVLASYKVLKPSKIVIHYWSVPELDSDAYYQYFPELIRDIPNLFLTKIKGLSVCSGNYLDKIVYISNILNQKGGIYIAENVIVTRPLDPYMKYTHAHFVSNTHPMNYDGVIIMRKNALSFQASRENIIQFLDRSKNKLKCVLHTQTSKRNSSVCIQVSSEIFPVDIFTESSYFAQVVRWLTYGTNEPVSPKSSSSVIVPNVVHYVWFGKNRTLNYFGYLSILSAIYILRVDAVYVHGDFQPQGRHWDKVRINPKVKFIVREFPESIFGQTVKVLSHGSDILRADILTRHGGIYMDWDVIWVKPLSENLRKYEAVASVDWPETGKFPDVFNLGVAIGSPGSKYYRFYLESMRNFIDTDWSHNPIHIPYKVYEKHPDLLHIERKLQMICAKGICHAPWLPDYKNELANHQKKVNWTEAFAVHWTYPDPIEFENEEILKTSRGPFAEIGQHVLRKAQLL